MAAGAVVLVAVIVGLAVGLAASPTLAPSGAQPVPPFALPGTIATTWLMPSGLATSTPCDKTLPWDLGCNNWMARDEDWAIYTQSQAKDAALLKQNLPAGGNTTVIVYFPLFLADPIHAGVGLARLQRVLADFTASDLRTILFVGRPEYHGNGTYAESCDLVHDLPPGCWARFEGLFNATLALPALQQHGGHVSVYWLSAFCLTHGGFCTEAQISSMNGKLRNLAHAGGQNYLQHVDGPWFDGCWPQPCDPEKWSVGGYSPASVSGADGLFAESWVQGSLVGALTTLFHTGAFSPNNTLLLNDVPNCDLYPVKKPCSTGSLQGDDSKWFEWLSQVGMAGTWGVWDAIDGGLSDANYYGDIKNDGSGLTAKGELHRRQALLAGAG